MLHFGVPMWQVFGTLLIGLALYYFFQCEALNAYMFTLCMGLLYKISNLEEENQALANKISEVQNCPWKKILKKQEQG